MKNILVTGGAGFIGSNFIRYMINKYDYITIINYDALTYAGNLHNLEDIEKKDNYFFIKGNILDKELFKKTMQKYSVDTVIHFAAESHVDRSINSAKEFAETNIMGTLSILEACKECWTDINDSYKDEYRYLQVSTDEVYGSLGKDGFFTENTPINPRSPYSASKAGADMLVKAFFDTYNFPALITRCSNNYGPYQFPEKLIPLMINNALHGKPLPVYGDGKNIRDWLYVEDHAKGIDMVQEKGRLFETYNIGGHNEKENIEIVHIILKTLREMLPDDDKRKEKINEELITYVEDRKGHDRRYAIAPDKIKKEVGWIPDTKFEDGIKMTIQWYL